MKLFDVYILSATKLRSHKIRTTIAIFVSSLIFAALVAALIIAQGATKSVDSFRQESLNDRYLVLGAKGNILERGLLSRQDLVNRAKQLYDDQVAAKKSEAKRLNIAYDPVSDPLPYSARVDNPDEDFLNPSSAITSQVLEEYYRDKPDGRMAELKKISKPYNPTDFFTINYLTAKDGSVTDLKQGQEDFSGSTEESSQDQNYEQPLYSSGVSLLPVEIATNFMLPSQSWKPESGEVPLIVTQKKAEQLLGLPALSDQATPKEKLDRIANVRKKVGEITITSCYRNSVSEQQIQNAIAAKVSTQEKDLQQVKSPFEYGLPDAGSCDAALVANDERTREQKLYDAHQREFDIKFDKVVDPIQMKVVSRVVGIAPDAPTGEPASNAQGLLQSLVGGVEIPLSIPRHLYEQMTNKDQFSSIFVQKANYLFGGLSSTESNFVEFSTATDARRFVVEQSCKVESDGLCHPADKPMTLRLYGNNSVALDDVKNKFTEYLSVSIVVAIALATIIMSITVGRMITDSRRETAVFRAIGFKRMDVSSIYILYTFFISIYIVLCALLLGVVAAYLVDYYFWQDLTLFAQLTFGASDVERQFHLFDINFNGMGLIICAILVSGMLSVIIPLLSNVRRSPIVDMRDE